MADDKYDKDYEDPDTKTEQASEAEREVSKKIAESKRKKGEEVDLDEHQKDFEEVTDKTLSAPESKREAAKTED